MSGSWADGLLVPFDVESTGVSVEDDRIVTAVVAEVRGPDVAARQWLVDPGIDIPAEATAIHGIDTETARAHGRPPDEAVVEIGTAIRGGWGKGGIVVGHNVGGYDFSILDREFRRHLRRPGFRIVGPIADTYVLDKHFDKYRRGKRNLTVTAAHYEVKLTAAHDALEDALAAARIFWRMCRVYPELGAMPWVALRDLQIKAKAEQATSLQDHLRAKARDAGESVEAVEAIVVDPHWPIAPVPAPVPATAAATTE